MLGVLGVHELFVVLEYLKTSVCAPAATVKKSLVTPGDRVVMIAPSHRTSYVLPEERLLNCTRPVLFTTQVFTAVWHRVPV